MHIKDLLRQISKIFIRYFSAFFIILVTIVSIGQYNDQGKINLLSSFVFALPIALLGGVIAGIFIGVFRRLETTPPWVNVSDYFEIDDYVITKGLSKINKKRIIIFTMIILWLPYGAFIMALDLPIFLVFGYIAALAIISQYLYFSKCPRCNHYFFYRAEPGTIGDTGNEKLNLWFGLGYRNTISNKCLNCGLSLKYKNII